MSQELLDPTSFASLSNTSLKIEKIFIPGYELVWKISDPEVGLQSFIAIHSRALGPALGGTRIYPYQHSSQALEDVLKLAKGMTYKASVSGVGFGGGKSVIIADSKTQKTPELLQSFGKAVDMLGGMYICAEDVGCSTKDVFEIRKSTKFCVGLNDQTSSGDPGVFTAFGVMRGVQSLAQKLYGSQDLRGKKIAIQGLGSVGSKLAEFLFWQGAELIVADLDLEVCRQVATRFGAKIVSVDEILGQECDILSPCALGGILHEKSIARLKCRGIAGAANNQLLLSSDADSLKSLGILYAPDFVINAGGLLNVSIEVEKNGYDPKIAYKKCDAIFDTLLSIYEMADKNHVSTHAAAITLAEHRIQNGIGKRIQPPIFHHSLNS